MKKLCLLVIGVGMTTFVSAQEFNLGRKFNSQADSASYALGVYTGQTLVESIEYYKETLVGEFRKGSFDIGLQAAIEGKEKVSAEEITAFLQYYFETVLPEKQAIANEAKRIEGEKFLVNIESQRGVQRSNSGLLYRINKIGNRVRATNDDSIEVKYKGTKTNGEVFDETPHGDEPTATFAVNGVIAGFAEGLKLIGEGGKITLWIPSELGYGEKGPDPNMPLIFEVELIRIIKE